VGIKYVSNGKSLPRGGGGGWEENKMLGCRVSWGGVRFVGPYWSAAKN